MVVIVYMICLEKDVQFIMENCNRDINLHIYFSANDMSNKGRTGFL